MITYALDPPETTTYAGDPVEYVLSVNDSRRHMTTGARAAARTLTLGAGGKRQDGRWEYGTLAESNESVGFVQRMREAGRIYDAQPDLLHEVAAGRMALSDALERVKKAEAEARERAAMTAEVQRDAPDLWALVAEERMGIEDAWAACRNRTREERDRAAAAQSALQQTFADITAALLTCSSYGGYDTPEARAKVMIDFDPSLLGSAHEAQFYTPERLAQARAFIEALEEWAHEH